MKRKAHGKKSLAAIAMLLLLGIPAVPAGPAAGQTVHTVARFSDGSEQATFHFPPEGGRSTASIALPRNAHVTFAGLNVEGLQGLDGSYPSEVRLSVGDSASALWRFGEGQAGAGQMGRQQLFSNGGAWEDVRFPAGGGTAAPAGILLPAGAVIRSASLQLQGGEGPHARPMVFGENPPATLTGWNAARGSALVAEVQNSTVDVYELNASTGAELRHRQLGLPAGFSSGIADLQYAAAMDTAAMLAPGTGIFLLDMGTGAATRLYDDGRAFSLSAMRLGEGWLAAAGAGWAGVTMLPAGPSHGINSTPGQGALAGRPVAVDYDSSGGRLFSAHDAGSGKMSIWSMAVASGNISAVDTGGQVVGLSSMRYLPDKGQLLLGESVPLSGRTAGRLVMLDITRGATYRTLFSGGEGVDAIQLDGQRAASMISGGELVVADLQNDSVDVLPVELPDGHGPLAWSYDFSGERLLADTSVGHPYILDFKTGRGRPLWRQGAGPAGINAARIAGNALVFGTGSGISAVNPGGTPVWRIECGMVGALATDSGSALLAAGASGGWALDPSSSDWGFFGLNLTVVDLRDDPPSARSWELPLDRGSGSARVTSLALDGAGARLFFATSGDGDGGGLRRLNLSSGTFDVLGSGPYPFVSLALSVDNRTLYAGTRGGGLLAVDTASGATRTLNSYNGSALLSPFVSCLVVDEFGRVLAGQAGFGRYGGGLTVLGPDMVAVRSYSSGPSGPNSGFDVRSIARDPRTMRIFLGLGNGGGIMVIDENARSQLRVSGLFGGPAGTAVSLGDICWNPGDGTMLCAGSGLGFHTQWAGERPQNVGLDIGADGTVDWTAPGGLETATITDIAPAVQGALAAAGGGTGLRAVGLRLSSTSAGIAGLRSLSITYGWARHVDMTGQVRAALASRAPSAGGIVGVLVEAGGGGLGLFNLSVTYQDDSPPRVKKIPQLASDTIARAPTVIDLGRYFTDSLSGANGLNYTVRTSRAPAGVEISLLFSRYLLVDSRGSSFRGTIRVNITVTDSSGLSSSAEFLVKVSRSDEPIPPQPAYYTFLWVMAIVLAAVGGWILILYRRVRRAKKE